MGSDDETEDAGALASAPLGEADTLASDPPAAAEGHPYDTHARVRRALFDADGSAVIGDFAIERQLGSGGMGTVYVARDTRLDRRVALKLVRSDRVSERSHTRLLREAKALGRLAHPNVVPVFEVGEHEGLVYLAMELVVGANLREALEEREYDTAEILAMFRQAGEGLAAAHAQGLIHRDFKPDNVLVGADGRVRVVDFGLVAGSEDIGAAATATPDLGEGSEGVALTRTGDLLGTPAYMAPEQYEGKETSAATDQFAFCVALYEALEGVRPFAGDTVPLLARAVTLEDPRPFERSSIPASVRSAILRGLARSPEARFGDMSALLSALELPDSAPAATRSSGLLLAALAGAGITLGVVMRQMGDSEEAEPGAAERADPPPAAAPPKPARPTVADEAEPSEPERLATGGQFSFSRVAADPAGAWLAYTEANDALVVMRSGQTTKTIAGAMSPLAVETPGGTMLYASTSDGLMMIEDDGGMKPVSMTGEHDGVVAVSPDHRRVLLSRVEPGHHRELVDLHGEHAPQTLDASLSVRPSFSPDSKWLALVGPDADRAEIYGADGQQTSTVALPSVLGLSWADARSLFVATASGSGSHGVAIRRCAVVDGVAGACRIEQEIDNPGTIPATFHGPYGDGWLFTALEVDAQRIEVLETGAGLRRIWNSPVEDHSTAAGWVGVADLAYLGGDGAVTIEVVDAEVSEAEGAGDDRSYLARGLLEEPAELFRYQADGTRTVVLDPERSARIEHVPACVGEHGCTVIVSEGESFSVAAIDPATGEIRPRWTLDAERVFDYSVSPDGRRIGVLHDGGGTVFELASGRALGPSPPRGAQRLALGREGEPSYAIAHGRTGHELLRIDADGTETVLGTAASDEIQKLHLSPNGRWLALELAQQVPSLVVFPRR